MKENPSGPLYVAGRGEAGQAAECDLKWNLVLLRPATGGEIARGPRARPAPAAAATARPPPASDIATPAGARSSGAARPSARSPARPPRAAPAAGPGPDGDGDGDVAMPEQPNSPQLKELVSRHEQHVRGNSVSEPVAPRQKPRARLRDSFIHRPEEPQPQQQQQRPEDGPDEHPEDARLLAQRACTLKSIIQKHEKLVASETETDRLRRRSQEEPDSRDSTSPEPSRRPGILKKTRDDQLDEVTSTSKTTVVSSRGHVRSDGTVSLTRDVIKGERVCRPGEEPVTKVTKTHYSYNTPEEKSTLSIEPYEDEDDDKPQTSPQSSRKSSVAKSSSPERGIVEHVEDEVKSSKVTSLIRDNSLRKFKVTEDGTNKNTSVTKTQITVRPGKLSTDDDANSVRRRSKLFEEKIDSHKTQTTNNKFTSNRVTDDQKFSSKRTIEPSKSTRPSQGTRSPTRSISPEKNIPDQSEKEPSRVSSKYTSSVTSVTQKSDSRISPERTPDSVRRKIFANEDEDEEYEVSRHSSSYSQSTTQVTTRKVTSQYETFEERRYSKDGLALEDRTSPDRKVSSLEYDDEEDENYKVSGHYSSSSKHSVRSSPDRTSYGREDDTDSQKNDRKYSASKSQYRTTGGTTVTTTETSSTNVSRSSTPSTAGRRRSSATADDRESSPTPGFTRGARGGSVRALSQKFQQAAAEANSSESSRTQRTYPKAGLIFRSASFRLNNGHIPVSSPTEEQATPTVKQTVSVEVKTGSSSTQSTPRAEQESKTFLNSQTKVTGVQDILTRMRNADQDYTIDRNDLLADTQEGDTEEDAEARSLLNKFLGAQVILQGMEPLMKGTAEAQAQSAVLVSQVERQRVMKTQKAPRAKKRPEAEDPFWPHI
ncbi:Uncharacterized protein GBIM_16674 [Gryllus bimaculatus]|nr:Uncharacterized protein GBIM_16674 [Gryllus bimaculatus]